MHIHTSRRQPLPLMMRMLNRVVPVEPWQIYRLTSMMGDSAHVLWCTTCKTGVLVTRGGREPVDSLKAAIGRDVPPPVGKVHDFCQRVQ